MAQKNQVSFSIPADILAKGTNYLTEVIIMFTPFLIGLTKEQRKALPKMSNKGLSFVTKVNDYCKLGNEFIPNFLDVAEMQKDLAAVQALGPLLKMVNMLQSNLDDTVMLCGSEAYAASLSYYNSVGYAAKKGNTSAKPIADDLAERYPGRTKKTVDPEVVKS